MSDLVIDWTPPALADVKAAFGYIASDNEIAAGKMVDRIEAAAENLARFSSLGRTGKIGRTQELVVAGTPYRLIYRPTAATIQILRVIHGARDWPRRR